MGWAYCKKCGKVADFLAYYCRRCVERFHIPYQLNLDLWPR